MARKKVKRISVNAMDEIMVGCVNTETVNWNGLDVVITKTLSLEDMLAFVDSVVKSCFDQATGAYMPEIKDFAIRSNVMERYANFTLPSKIERQYDVVMRSGAFEMVLNHLNAAQFNELIRAIDDKLKNAADVNIQTVFRQFDEVVDSFNNLQEKIGTLFSGIDSSDIENLMGAISDGGIDEAKVVKAYIDQGRDEKRDEK